jgi:hypothetical protein
MENMIKVILWACIEDYAGLWELLWEVNSAFPEITEDERREQCSGLLLQMLERDLVNIYQCQEPYGELIPLKISEAREVLVNRVNWKAPELNAISIRVGATLLGNEVFEKQDYSFLGRT